MKNTVKAISLLVLLVVAILGTAKVSFNKPITDDGDEVSYVYAIRAFTSPACYTGTCTAIRTSDGAVYPMPYQVSMGGYYTYASGLGPGTYNIYVCCGGRSGSGTVTIPNQPQAYVDVTISLAGYCEDSD